MSELRIVQGNNFGTAIRIEAVDAKGHAIQDFSLSESTDIRVWYVFAGKEVEIEAWTIEDDRILILWPKDLRYGTYDLFQDGMFGQTAWRNAMRAQFTIVKYNYEANIPDDVIVLDGIYQLSAEMALLSKIIVEGIPSETIPLMDGEAEVGTEERYARGDHRHPSDTNKQNVIADLDAIRSGAQKGATAYQKPTDGIPATDLASGVIPDVSNFITKSVNDLVNYYTKSQTYTQAEVQQLINAVKQFTYESVSTLPTASSSTMNKIYLVPSSDPQTQNVKDEYITIQSGSTYSWELIGNTSVDLSGYVTTTDLNTALASYTTTADLNTLLAGYQTKIDSNHKLDYSLLSNTPTIPDAQIQSDWEQTVTTAKDYIKNKPTIPSAQVNSDWNASSGVAQILNKPTIPSALSQMTEDTTHRVVTDAEKSTWNGKADKVLVTNHGTSDTTYSVTPNTLHIWGTVASLSLTLATPTDTTIVNEYMIEFVSGSTATTLSLPSSVEWAESCGALSVEASKTYQISIVNNIGIWIAV